jgi:hypothetical protein
MVGALLLREKIEEFADLSPGCLDVARLCASDQVFEFGEDLLNRSLTRQDGNQRGHFR